MDRNDSKLGCSSAIMSIIIDQRLYKNKFPIVINALKKLRTLTTLSWMAQQALSPLRHYSPNTRTRGISR